MHQNLQLNASDGINANSNLCLFFVNIFLIRLDIERQRTMLLFKPSPTQVLKKSDLKRGIKLKKKNKKILSTFFKRDVFSRIFIFKNSFFIYFYA